MQKLKDILYVVVMVMIICLGLYMLVNCIVDEENNKRLYKTHWNKQEIDMIMSLTKHGAEYPVSLGIAVCKTKRPKLMGAIAIVESTGNIRAVGDSGKSKGAFQVQEKHWGKVPRTATEQAQQSEKILEELMASNARGSLRYVLAKYNGGTNPPRSSYKYADKVIRIARQL